MKRVLAWVAAVLLILAAWWLMPRQSTEKQERGKSAKGETRGAVEARAARTTAAERPAAAVISSEWNDLIEWLEADPKPDGTEVRQRLMALRAAWAKKDPHVRAEAIGMLLREGRDASTGLRFRVGLHGMLDEWPSARVFLLDALATADPDTVAGIARQILESTASPEEYAVALRPLARDGLARADDAELLGYFNTLLSRNAWHSASGFAESLDLARTIGNAPTAASLLAWAGNPRLQSMALHEMAAEHPEAFVGSLSLDSTLAPSERASLMARLSPDSVEQAATLDQYLADPAVGPEEKTAFIKRFPLRSATTGYRLYSPLPRPYTAESVGAGDRAALDLARRWLAMPSLAEHHEELRKLETRLTGWIEANRD